MIEVKKQHIRPSGDSVASVVRLLKEGCEVDFVPEENYMLPLIRGGKDIVTLRSPDRELSRGDIVLAEVGTKGYLLLRILDRNQNSFLLAGDAALDWMDIEECTLNDIVGRVVFIQRGNWGFRPGRGEFWMWLFPVRDSIMKLYNWIFRKDLTERVK